jgi:hypothetical protein
VRDLAEQVRGYEERAAIDRGLREAAASSVKTVLAEPPSEDSRERTTVTAATTTTTDDAATQTPPSVLVTTAAETSTTATPAMAAAVSPISRCIGCKKHRERTQKLSEIVQLLKTRLDFEQHRIENLYSAFSNSSGLSATPRIGQSFP